MLTILFLKPFEIVQLVTIYFVVINKLKSVTDPSIFNIIFNYEIIFVLKM